MSKDVNIHVKTTGVQQAAKDMNDFYATMREADKDIAAGLKQTGNAAEEMGAKSSRAAGWLKEAFTAVAGPLGIGAAVLMVVNGVKRIIAAFDDMKRASAEAVHDLANQQRAAANLFEAFDAYSQKDRKAVLSMARSVQAGTGLPFEESQQLLEAQKRTFGNVSPESTNQFAAYWKLHAGPSTVDLVRWMGASGINAPDQQGRIMRMISTVADSSKLQEEEIISAIAARGGRFRAMGWTPEQTITNIGKALSGLSPAEAGKAMRGMFESLEGFTEEKAIELKAPKNIAASEAARLEWLKSKAGGLPLEQRNALLRKVFGPSYPYIGKMLFEPTSPEMQQALEYAAGPEAAAEEARNAAAYRETTEGRVEKAGGGAGKFGLNISGQQELRTAIREYGKQYLEYLRVNDRLEYEKLKMLPEELGYETAALKLWQIGKPKRAISAIGMGSAGVMVAPDWSDLPLEQRLSGVEKAAGTININYNTNTNYYPVAGTAADRDIGPRADRDFK